MKTIETKEDKDVFAGGGSPVGGTEAEDRLAGILGGKPSPADPADEQQLRELIGVLLRHSPRRLSEAKETIRMLILMAYRLNLRCESLREEVDRLHAVSDDPQRESLPAVGSPFDSDVFGRFGRKRVSARYRAASSRAAGAGGLKGCRRPFSQPEAPRRWNFFRIFR